MPLQPKPRTVKIHIDYFLVLSEDSDRFFMIRSWTDDEQCLKYIDSLYESGEYEKIDQEWTGGSQPVDDEVKNYAIQYVSEYLGMNLTTDMYDDYFYSYCMDLTSMGDMDTVIGGMLLMFALLLIRSVWDVSFQRYAGTDAFAALKDRISLRSLSRIGCRAARRWTQNIVRW